MDEYNRILLAAVLVVGVLVGAGTFAVLSQTDSPVDQSNTTEGPYDDSGVFALPAASGDADIEQFESEEAFQAYVQRGQRIDSGPVGRPRMVGGNDVVVMEDADVEMSADAEPTAMQSGGVGGDAGGGSPDRISDTNVQVQGLDEPDILKPDGKHVYYAPHFRDHHGKARGLGGQQTQVISAGDPANPEVIANIDSNGKMLISGDDLVVLEEDRLLGYNVNDADNPTQQWTKPLNNSVVTARLYDGRLYLVTQEQISLSDPCPVEPLGGDTVIECSDIHHPRGTTPVDATYSALVIDPAAGDVESAESFVGTSENTAVYMSPNALYVTYTQPADRGQLRIDFLLDEQRDKLPDWVVDRLETIDGYEISSRSKQTEAQRVLDRWYRSLEENERETARENLRNDYRDYISDRQRELVRTGIVQVDVAGGDLSVDNVETVPGRPLNQFSLSEHNGSLRITTTIPAAGGQDSRNDLYVLDASDLSRQGEVTDMGLNERVYSVRYVGDTAYIVTFRRVDPFHVVDLSNPNDPELDGELKLPGFSTYLHPIDDDRVLGIGKEDGQVKAVMFDVSDPSNPTVQDDFILDSHWSAIDESHHAFLLDKQHGVFFLPTGGGGNIIDYTGGELELETQIDTGGPALRAMYIDDYMYVFGGDELTVVDEQNWERIKQLKLGS
jgi:inhibitor of cysteine peptidase